MANKRRSQHGTPRRGAADDKRQSARDQDRRVPSDGGRARERSGSGSALGLKIAAAALSLVVVGLVALRVLLFAGVIGSSSEEASAGGRSASMVTVVEATVDDPVEIDVMMIGDILVHTGVWESGEMSDGTLNYDHLFTNVASWASAADLAILNQETQLGGTELGLSGYPCFNSPQELGVAEVAAGFNCVACATNHTIDLGSKAVAAELTFWRTNYPDVIVLGIADSEETYDEIHYFEKDGFTIALLNYTYGTNGISIPSDNPYAVTLLDEDKVSRDLELASAVADMVIVIPHWGDEYVTEPNDYQEYWAQYFCDNGADLIIGSHPHCLEPVEVIESEDGHRALCYWSLGNFVSSQTGTLKATGGMATVTLVKDDDECYISEWALYPTVCHQASGTSFTTYLLADYTDELVSQSSSNTGSIQDIQDFCTSVLGESYSQEESVLRGGEVRSDS